TYYLALGSNLGDRLGYLARAIRAMARLGDIESISGVYETAPWGYLDQGPFLNMAVALESELEPDALLARLEEIQRFFGKVVTVKNGPRTLDIDILLAENEVIHTPLLDIPHPRLAERRFVLEPLSEIAPLAIHPVLNVTIENLLGRLPSDPSAMRVATPDQILEEVELLK
ncbi:MAG: 2-amino-4-hydroxy-6-hydroxymethyldihydropteridine diphosphokinase, partial [bacterium]